MAQDLEVQKGQWRAALKQVLGDDRRFRKNVSTNENLRWILKNLDDIVDTAIVRKARINQAAAELRSQDPSLTTEGSIAKVFTVRPDPIDEFRTTVEKLQRVQKGAGEEDVDKEDEAAHEALENHATALRGMNPQLSAEQALSQAAQERPELTPGYRRHAQRKAQALGAPLEP